MCSRKFIFMKWSSIIIFCLIFNVRAFGEDFQAIFQLGNKAYTEENYQEAAKIYERLISKNQTSFELNYNLGNAYFRLNEIPKAILNYERALQIRPHHKATQYNLKLSNQRTLDQISETPLFFLVEWWIGWQGFLSSTVWAILAIVLMIGSGIGWISWLFGVSRKIKKIGFVSGILGLSISLFFMLTAWQRYSYEQDSNMAILFAKETALKSSADDRSPDILLLHEGIKVELLDTIGLWHKVRLPNGEQGWLPIKDLIEI